MDTPAPVAQVMHTFKEASSSKPWLKPVLIWIAVILLGLGTGYVLANANKTGKSLIALPGSKGSAEVGKTYGSADTTTFSDTAEGVMKEGGINGEGQFHLVRPGGDSQNVYLTSSLVDLSQFIGHKVKVWGQTQKAQTAGWLMDVGKVQVEE